MKKENTESKHKRSKDPVLKSKRNVPSEISQDIRKEILNDDSLIDIDNKKRGFDSIDDTGDVDFGGLYDNKKNRNDDIGKPGSKVRRLKRMLQVAENKKQRLEELKLQGHDGVKRAHAEQWNDILKEASGERVLLDTSKIKKALKRKEKIKLKSKEEWKVRCLVFSIFSFV